MVQAARSLGEVPYSRVFDAPDNPHGPFAGRGRSRRRPPENERSYPAQTRQWVLMPGTPRVRYNTLLDDYAGWEAAASRFNRYTDAADNRSASSPAASPNNHLAGELSRRLSASCAENFAASAFRLTVRRMASECGSLLIIEEGQPVVEQAVRGILPAPLDIRGRMTGQLPRTGELTPDSVRAALGLAPHATHAASHCQSCVRRPCVRLRPCGRLHGFEKIADEHENAKVFSAT